MHVVKMLIRREICIQFTFFLFRFLTEINLLNQHPLSSYIGCDLIQV